MNFHLFQFCMALLAFELSLTSGFPIILDVAQDEEILMWDIGGYVEYFRDGNAISGTINNYLPKRFDYSHIDLTKGIWAVVPTSGSHCNESETEAIIENLRPKFSKKYLMIPDRETSGKSGDCDRSAIGSFKFHLLAQLADSMEVKYLFGGPNATIRILTGDGLLIKELKSEKRELDFWQEESTKLQGHAMRLEAIVGGEGDYILIDRIIVNTLEVTTTTAAPTRKPPPAPTSGQNRRMLDYGSLLFMIILALSIVLN